MENEVPIFEIFLFKSCRSPILQASIPFIQYTSTIINKVVTLYLSSIKVIKKKLIF